MDARLDRAAQKRIPGFKKSYRRRADAEKELHRGAGVRGGAARGRGAGPEPGEARVRFECRMLQRMKVSMEGEGERREWKTMACADENDFLALKTRAWLADAFVGKAEVVL